MMVFNLINFAQFERKQTGERISANFKSRAERGLWNGGQLPLGYKRDPTNAGRLLVHAKESKTVKLIFKTFLANRNLRDTCLKLNEQGFTTKKYVNGKGETVGGNHFTVQSLHHLLTNTTFIGQREINKKRGDLRMVKASWAPIIDKKTFDIVQKQLTKNRRSFKPDSWKTYAYPLTGIAVCGECGKSLNGKSAHGKTQKHHYYDHARTLRGDGTGHVHKCRIQRLRAPKIEEMVLSSLKTILSDPAKINHAISIYHKERSKNKPVMLHGLKNISDEVKTLETKQNNLIARISELPQKVSAEPFYKQLTLVQEQITEKSRIRESLLNQSLQETNSKILPSDLALRIQRTVDQLEKTPPENRRGVFEGLLQFAEFHPTKIKLGVYTTAGAALSGSGISKLRPTVSSTTIKVGGEGEIRIHTFYVIDLIRVFNNNKYLEH